HTRTHTHFPFLCPGQTLKPPSLAFPHLSDPDGASPHPSSTPTHTNRHTHRHTYTHVHCDILRRENNEWSQTAWRCCTVSEDEKAAGGGMEGGVVRPRGEKFGGFTC